METEIDRKLCLQFLCFNDRYLSEHNICRIIGVLGEVLHEPSTSNPRGVIGVLGEALRARLIRVIPVG